MQLNLNSPSIPKTPVNQSHTNILTLKIKCYNEVYYAYISTATLVKYEKKTT